MGGGAPCTQKLLDDGLCFVPEPHPSIFGMRQTTADFDGRLVATSFCTLVLFTCVIEHLYEHVEHAVHKRAAVFGLVWEKVVKELMILGLVSFTIFIGEQAFHLNQTSFFLPLEFAHIVIFVLAIFYVAEALFFLWLSESITKHYDTCLAMSKGDIAARLQREWGASSGDEGLWRGTFWQRLRWRWSGLNEIVDIQIIQAVFIKKHRLPEGFDFGRYLIHSFDEQVGSMLDVSPRSWLFTIITVWLLWAAAWATESAGGDQLADSFGAFVLLGAALNGISLLCLYVGNRARSETVGLAIHVAGAAMTPSRMVEHALMNMADKESIDSRIASGSVLSPRASETAAAEGGGGGEGGFSNADHASFRSVENPITAARRAPGLDVVADALVQEAGQQQQQPASGGAAAAAAAAVGGGLQPPAASSVGLNTGLRVVASVANLRAKAKHSKERRMSLNTRKAEILQHAARNWDLTGAFCISPKIIRALLELAYILKCLYLALFFCYFAGSLRGLEQTVGVGIVLAFEVLFHCVIGPQTIQTFYFMAAVSTVKPDVLGAVVEDMEQARLLKLYLLRKLRRFAESEGKGGAVTPEWLEAKFGEWASLKDDDGLVDRAEMKLVLAKLDIYLSRQSFNKLMRLLDPDRNGTIEYSEFAEFVCSLSQAEVDAAEADGEIEKSGLSRNNLRGPSAFLDEPKSRQSRGASLIKYLPGMTRSRHNTESKLATASETEDESAGGEKQLAHALVGVQPLSGQREMTTV